MNDNPWVAEKEASERLGVTEKTLQLWREIGYLKPGTHWRSSPSQQKVPWTPTVIYHVRWCKEVIDYWRDQDAPVSTLAA
tara:strand:- start:887 stop:1126 length:240 start_codon:yes stop_codon:yes gene_type:complete